MIICYSRIVASQKYINVAREAHCIYESAHACGNDAKPVPRTVISTSKLQVLVLYFQKWSWDIDLHVLRDRGVELQRHWGKERKAVVSPRGMDVISRLPRRMGSDLRVGELPRAGNDIYRGNPYSHGVWNTLCGDESIYIPHSDWEFAKCGIILGSLSSPTHAGCVAIEVYPKKGRAQPCGESRTLYRSPVRFVRNSWTRRIESRRPKSIAISFCDSILLFQMALRIYSRKRTNPGTKNTEFKQVGKEK